MWESSPLHTKINLSCPYIPNTPFPSLVKAQAPVWLEKKMSKYSCKSRSNFSFPSSPKLINFRAAQLPVLEARNIQGHKGRGHMKEE